MQSSHCSIRLALALLALLFSATLVSAEEGAAREKKPSKATLEKYDADKDGQLNDEEKAKAKAAAVEKARHTREENLAKYDTNQDGKLDEEEKAAKKTAEEAAKAAKKAAKDAGKK